MTLADLNRPVREIVFNKPATVVDLPVPVLPITAQCLAILPWWEYFLGVMLFGSYQEFERRVGLVTAGRGSKTAMILDAIGHFMSDFTIRDLQERCPQVGIDLIRRILREQRNAGKLECLGRGPNARWRNR